MASGTSKETEIKLTNVARASLEELLEDYRDYLRTRGLQEWTKDHQNASRLRALNRIRNAEYATFQKGIENPDPAISANVIIGLIRVASYLLGRQIQHLEEGFLKEGGLRECARLQSRRKWSAVIDDVGAKVESTTAIADRSQDRARQLRRAGR